MRVEKGMSQRITRKEAAARKRNLEGERWGRSRPSSTGGKGTQAIVTQYEKMGHECTLKRVEKKREKGEERGKRSKRTWCILESDQPKKKVYMGNQSVQRDGTSKGELYCRHLNQLGVGTQKKGKYRKTRRRDKRSETGNVKV